MDTQEKKLELAFPKLANKKMLHNQSYITHCDKNYSEYCNQSYLKGYHVTKQIKILIL